MPYKNIIFIKLFLDLFDEDDRFLYKLTERQQLLFIKMLYLAGRTHNKIPKNVDFLISKINYQGSKQDITQDLRALKSVFSKFTETKHHHTFRNFSKLHNRINDAEIGSSNVSPKTDPRVTPKESKLKEKEKEKKKDKYLDSVYLSAEEYQSLIDTFGKKNIDTYIENLNDYVCSKGKKYKSHYHALRSWLRRDGKTPPPKEKVKPTNEGPDHSPEGQAKVKKLIDKALGRGK